MPFLDTLPRTGLAFWLFYTFVVASSSYAVGWVSCYEKQPIEKLTHPECVIWK